MLSLTNGNLIGRSTLTITLLLYAFERLCREIDDFDIGGAAGRRDRPAIREELRCYVYKQLQIEQAIVDQDVSLWS